MTLRQLQRQIAETLNDDEALRQGGCRAFAEDSHDVVQEVATHLQQAGGVALVVLTPSAERNGSSPRGLPARLDGVAVSAVEVPALNRLDTARMTALQAAQRAAHLLDGRTLEWRSIRQDAAPDGTVTARAEFGISVMLTPKED